MIKIRPNTPAAYNLLHEGILALSQMEAAGVRIDVKYLEKTILSTQRKIREQEVKLKESKVYRLWKRRFKDRTKLGSREQLGEVLYKVIGYECTEFTEHGRPKADEEAFETIDDPFVEDYIRWCKLSKMLSTNLYGIKRELVGEYVRCIYNLHLVKTFRGSCSNFNFQNLPVRNFEMGDLIRSAFIPRKNHQLLEIDFGGIEVKVSACYHRDPMMIKYITDPTTDMHRDMAMEIYMVGKNAPPEYWKSKDSKTGNGSFVRYCAKNMYVFPEFYGSYYMQCAKNLWKALSRHSLTLPGGVPIAKHLRRKGIKDRGDVGRGVDVVKGTFVKHLQDVEQRFWGERFKVYHQWKMDYWDAYQRRGWFNTLTGFHIEGVFKRNDVVNYPIQGSAFHCLLWSLIRITNWLKENKMKTKIVGQIHDSLIFDAHKDEVKKVMEFAHYVMTVELPQVWKWIIVPLEVEAELAPVGEPWSAKKSVKF